MATPTALPASFTAGDVLTAANMNLLRGAFRVMQVVQGTTTTEVNTTSTSYVTTNITATITPSSTDSKVLAIWSCTASKDTTVTSSAYFALFRGTVAGTQVGGGSQAFFDLDNNARGGVGFAYLDSPATTSAQDYTVGIKTVSASTTVTANKAGSLGTIILMEISA
jgi:hypothetical protein